MLDINQKVRIAVDAMGGDYAPEETIKGAVMGAKKGNVEIILVGPTEVLERELSKNDVSQPPQLCRRMAKGQVEQSTISWTSQETARTDGLIY